MRATQANAGVCAFLGTMDHGFNIEILVDNGRVTQR